MADLWLRRTLTGFTPDNSDDVPPGWRVGELLLATVRKPRNIKRHRKAFVLLTILFPHTDYPNKEILRHALTVGAGFVDTIINPLTGEVCFVPKSWAFDKMDEIEFEELYQRMIDVAMKIVPNSTREDWQDAEQEISRL